MRTMSIARKVILSCLFVILAVSLSMFALLMPTKSVAKASSSEIEYWDGTTNTTKASAGFTGAGTEGSPYCISDANQFCSFVYLAFTNANSFANKYYKLTNDIYINEYNGTALTNSNNNGNPFMLGDNGGRNYVSSTFSGTFDGNGHTIYGYYFANTNEGSNSALFKENSGTIKNLKMANAYISTTGSNVSGFAITNSGTIENCSFEGKLVSSTSSVTFAGFVGNKNTGTISNVISNAKIEGETDKTVYGIAVNSGNGTVTNGFYFTDGDITYESDTSTAVTEENVISLVSNLSNIYVVQYMSNEETPQIVSTEIGFATTTIDSLKPSHSSYTLTGYSIGAWVDAQSGGSSITNFTKSTKVYPVMTFAKATVQVVAKNVENNLVHDSTEGADYYLKQSSGSYNAGTVTITVNATHELTTNFTYAWYKDTNLINGATSNVLVLGTVAHSGTYYCKVTAINGSDTSTVDTENVAVKINVRKIAVPQVSTNITYNGSEQGSGVYENGYIEVNETKKTDVGSDYKTTVSLKDTTNTVWADETTANKQLSWSIKVASITASADNIEITYNNTDQKINVVVKNSAAVVLPDAIVKYSTTENGEYTTDEILCKNAGTYTIYYEASNGSNYGTAKGSAVITINKATIDMKDVTWDYVSAFEADGTNHVVSLKNLPTGVTATYENNEAVDAGKYTAKATLVYDSVNYDLVNNSIGDLSWEVVKAGCKIGGVIDGGSSNNYTGLFVALGVISCVGVGVIFTRKRKTI